MRKNTGIVRTLDEVGRIVLPIELRRNMGLDVDGTPLEIYVDDDAIVLRPVGIKCRLCGQTDADKLISLKDLTLCHGCIQRLNKMAQAKEEALTMTRPKQ